MAKKKKGFPKYPSWLRHGWWFVPACAFLTFIPSLFNEFTLDDIPVIEDNHLIQSLDKLPEIWTSHYWSGKIDAGDTGLYRPLTLSTYALQYAFTGDRPFPFHLLNILLHALTCFLVLKYLDLLFGVMYVTMLSGFLFAIHPVHSEAVAGIVGRAEILAALFIITAGISYHYFRQQGNLKWLFALIASTIGAITSKEHGFMLPVIIVLQEIFYVQSIKQLIPATRKLIGIGCIMVICITLWIIRAGITGPAKPHEQWLHVDSIDRMATSIRTTVEYIGLHLFPVKLSADYWSDQVKVTGPGHLVVILSLLGILCLLAIALWQFKKNRSISWGIIFFFLALAPVANFFFAAGFLKAERILYIPSIGLITAMASALIILYKKPQWRILALVIVGVMSVFFIVKSAIRTTEWKNNYTLALATLKVSPSSPRFNNMMGLEMRSQKKNREALDYFEKAVAANPYHVPALVNLGTEYKNFNRLVEAVSTLQKALQTDSSTMMAYVNLMAVYREMKDYDKNLEIALLALRRYPASAPVLWNAGNAYHLKNNITKANELRARAKEIQPNIGN